MKNPYLAVEFAESLKIGTRSYELIEVLSQEETMERDPPKGVYERGPSFF